MTAAEFRALYTRTKTGQVKKKTPAQTSGTPVNPGAEQCVVIQVGDVTHIIPESNTGLIEQYKAMRNGTT